MQLKSTTQKDTCSDSLSPPPTDKTCEGQTTTTSGVSYHGHVDLDRSSTHTSDQRMSCVNGSLPEKSPLVDVPLHLEQLSMKHNREAPPPYEENPSLQGVWTTDITKVHPEKLRMFDQNKRRLGMFFRPLLRLLIIVLGVYLCFNALPTLVTNYIIAQNLCTVQSEALQAVNVVKDINNIPPEHEGKLIHVTGLLSITTPLSYKECGISARSVKVKRVFDTSRAIPRSEYEPWHQNNIWIDITTNKTNICGKQEFELLSLDDDEKIANVAKIGSLQLGARIKEKFEYNRIISSKLLIIDDHRAFKVTYIEAGKDGEKYSVMGQLVNGTIQPYTLFNDYTINFLNDFEIPAESMILYRVNDRTDTLNAENWSAYLKIAMLVPLTAAFYLLGYMEAAKKYKRNRLILGMPQ